MRAKRLVLASMILSMLVTTNMATASPPDAQDSPTAVVAGKCTLTDVVSVGSNEGLRDEFYGMERLVHAYAFDSPDPRLDCDAIGTATWFGWYAPDFVAVSVVRWDLRCGQGSWSGTSTGIGTFDDLNLDTILLEGARGNDGLTAYLLLDWSGHPARYTGVIFHGRMPAFPEPATTESAG